MNTNYKLLLALFCGALVACSENSIEDSLVSDGAGAGGDGAINYTIVCDDMATTRGTLVSQARDIESLGVYGVLTDTRDMYIENTKANWNGFETTHYWPGNSTLDLFAYSPYLELGVANSNGLTLDEISSEQLVVSYSVPETIADQPDFMISTPILEQNSQVSSVEFNLQHVLASVSFLVQGDDPCGVIDQISVYNIIDNGVVTMDAADGDISWVIGTATSDYYPIMSNSVTTSSMAQTAMAADQYLMMVPQNVDDASYDVTATYTIDYEYPYYETEQGFAEYEFEGDWEAGKIHVYSIILSDNLPFIVINDETTQAEIAAKIAKMVEWGYTDITIVGGYGHDYFGDNALGITAYEGLLNYAIEYALEYDDNQFNAIDLSRIDMYGDEEATNHVSRTTFGGNLTDAQKDQITSIILPADLAKIYSYSFQDYTNLTEVIFPEGCGVIDIAVNTFENCTSLESFIGSSSIEKVLAYAFLNCSSLTTVYIPGAGTSFGQYLFQGCSSLTEIWMATEGEIGDIDNEVFTEYESSGFSTANCTLYTNYANVSAGNASTYYGNGGGQITISGNTVTITEINEDSTSSESFSYTFENIVLLDYEAGIYYVVDTNGNRTGVILTPPTQS